MCSKFSTGGGKTGHNVYNKWFNLRRTDLKVFWLIVRFRNGSYICLRYKLVSVLLELNKSKTTLIHQLEEDGRSI